MNKILTKTKYQFKDSRSPPLPPTPLPRFPSSSDIDLVDSMTKTESKYTWVFRIPR